MMSSRPLSRNTVLRLSLAGLLAYCYAPVVVQMVGQWWSDDVYAYCFLIPFISGYLIWNRRALLKRLEIIPDSGLGFVVVAAGLLLLVLGQAARVLAVQELSLLVVGTGVLMYLYGRAYARALWFPIVYLVFMIPSWELFTDRLQYPLQQLSATIGVAFLSFVGIPVNQQGVFIELPNITLHVAKVCSGVNYLIAVLAIGLPLAYELLNGWRRMVLVSFALGVAVLSNGFRIALIGSLSYYGLNPTIHGPYHVLQGMFVSIIGYCAIFVGCAVLRRGVSTTKLVPLEAGSVPCSIATGEFRYKPLAFATMVALLLATGSYLHFHGERAVLLMNDLRAFPREIGPWQEKESRSDNQFFQEMTQVFHSVGVDHDLARSYRWGKDEVGMYVGYFESQHQGKELINYRTADLHQGVSRMRLDIGGSTVEVNRVFTMEGGQGRLVIFWYDLDGWLVADRLHVQMITALRWLVSGRTSGSIILLCIPVESAEKAEAAGTAGAAFLREMTPLLERFLPRSGVVSSISKNYFDQAEHGPNPDNS